MKNQYYVVSLAQESARFNFHFCRIMLVSILLILLLIDNSVASVCCCNALTKSNRTHRVLNSSLGEKNITPGKWRVPNNEWRGEHRNQYHLKTGVQCQSLTWESVVRKPFKWLSNPQYVMATRGPLYVDKSSLYLVSRFWQARLPLAGGQTINKVWRDNHQ